MSKNNTFASALGIASCAVALAVLPLAASATSANIGEDEVTITVKTGCTLSAADEGEFSPLDNTYSGSVAPGEAAIITGGEGGNVNSLKVKCNEAGTYAITATATDLTHTDEETKIDAADWAIKYNGNESYTDFTGSSQTLVSVDTAASGDHETFTINSYKVKTTTATKAGAYTGSVTYTLTYDGE